MRLAAGTLAGGIARLAAVLAGVTIAVCALPALIPGNAAQTMFGGGRASPASLAAVARSYGLNEPWPVQYARYLTRIAHGHLGYSLVAGEDAGAVIASRAPATLLLIGYATVIAVAVAVPAGLAAARRAGRPADHLIRGTAVAALCIPTFWLSALLIAFVAVPTGLFPPSGYGTGLAGHLWYLTLPAVALAAAFITVIIRGLRAAAIDVLAQPWIRAARGAGIAPRRLLWVYVLRAAAVPVVTVVGLNVGWLISGTVAVEAVFAVPGVGQLLVTSLQDRDYQVVQALALLFAVAVVTVNVATDLAYRLLDPRLRR